MVRYRLATLIPEGSFTNVQLLDGIPNGLQFLDDGTATVAFVCNSGPACMTSSTLAGAGLVVNGSTSSVSPTFAVPGPAISGGPFGSGTDVTFSFGDVANSDSDLDSEYVVVEFNALVMNVNSTATINQGVDNLTGASNTNNRQNDVTLFVNGSQIGAASPNVTVAIAEPAITSITKSVVPAAGPYLPGDSLTYTLSFSNNATGNNAATAFDIVLVDTFDLNLVPGTVNISSTQGATCAGGTTFSTGNSTVAQLISVNVSCLDPGNSVTITIDATISNAPSSGTTIVNASSLTYTSLPDAQGNCSTTPFTCAGVGASGSGTGERIGSGGSGADGLVLNNYAVTSNTVNTTVTFGSVTITKDAVPNDAQDFSFTGTGPNTYDFGGGFNLDDDSDTTLVNTQTFTPLPPGAYTVTEGAVGGWVLTGLTCVDPDAGSTSDLGTATAAIDLDAGETITCTFTNTPTPAPAMTVLKSSATATLNATGPVNYSYLVTNTGNVPLTGISLNDDNDNNDMSCPTATLAVGANMTCTATHIFTQAELDANGSPTAGSGNLTNNVTASSNEALDATDTLDIPISQNPAISLAKTGTLNDDDGIAGLSAGDTISYAFTIQNTGNVTLTNITLADTVGGVTISGGPIGRALSGLPRRHQLRNPLVEAACGDERRVRRLRRRHRHVERWSSDHAERDAPARPALCGHSRSGGSRCIAGLCHCLLAGARPVGALSDGEGEGHGRSRRGASRLLAGRGGAGRRQSADDPGPRRKRRVAANARHSRHRRRHSADRHGG
jgi:fimbrial isopeptide formation D2 family protein